MEKRGACTLRQETWTTPTFMMKNYELSRSEAERGIKKRDQTRKRFLAFFTEKEHIDDANNYDLVINMDRISMDMAEKLVLDLISDKK